APTLSGLDADRLQDLSRPGVLARPPDGHLAGKELEGALLAHVCHERLRDPVIVFHRIPSLLDRIDMASSAAATRAVIVFAPRWLARAAHRPRAAGCGRAARTGRGPSP